MANIAYNEVASYARGRTDWGAVWGGVFVFIAIWSVFGLLGMAIFASAANPEATRPVSGMGVGIGIWSIVLTIIAMYVAGRETGRLAGVTSRHDGLVHGMIMFGLSVMAILAITVLGGSTLTGGAGSRVPLIALSVERCRRPGLDRLYLAVPGMACCHVWRFSGSWQQG